MKLTHFILIALISATLVRTENFNNCIRSNYGSCFECYESRPAPAPGGCLPREKPNDTCAVYVRDVATAQTFCTACEPGNTLNVARRDRKKTTCSPGNKIKNCLSEISEPGSPLRCFGCSDGLYSYLNFNDRTNTCQNISNSVPHCMWGGVATFNTSRCLRCNEGYSMHPITGKCVTSPEEGCWIGVNGICEACNPYIGYSMNANGSCYKGKRVEGHSTGGLWGISQMLIQEAFSGMGFRD